jgi:hypothetical protein
MRIGLTVPTPGENPDLGTLLGAMEHADTIGLHAVWMPNVSSRGFDATAALALGGARTRRVELGTFVVPTFTRHPVVMAQQAHPRGGRRHPGGGAGGGGAHPEARPRDLLGWLRGLLRRLGRPPVGGRLESAPPAAAGREPPAPRLSRPQGESDDPAE